MMKRSRPSSRPIPTRRRVLRRPEEADWSWAEDHRGKPARKPPPRARAAAVRVVKSLAGTLNPAVRELDTHWPDIVGEKLAQLSKPEKFQSGAGGRTLVIKARGPAATLVEAQSPQILERAARYSGKPIARLKVVQGPLHEDFTPARVRKSRIIKVERLDEGAKNLDALMDDWAEAIARDHHNARRKRK